ncbi:aldo/keto reductase [Vibrio astriarenae]|uniref:aldo/keto reductase n=1 Tax=Vibrio astriarenae TaxID=1481923 RepID=UPI003735489C
MKVIKMQQHSQRKAHKIEVTPLILGSGSFLTESDRERAYRLLDAFVALGGNTIDTARHYGIAEHIIGDWLTLRENRDKIVLLTKGGHPTQENPAQHRLSATAISEDLNTSLSALNTERVEFYALHRDDPAVGVDEIMHQLHQFVQQGKVGAIGASNWKTDRIIAANQYAQENNLTPFTFNSPGFSLATCNRPRWPGCEIANAEMLEWHKDNNIPLVAWSPQGAGFFSGKYSPDNLDNREMVDVYYNDANWKKYDRAATLAPELDVSTSQIALAYVLNQPFSSLAVIGARNEEQLREAFKASQLSLTPEQVSWLNLQQ